ncbi:Predicted arabinose efflux permease, MFS family [Streptomyces misionensis]|uniref:Predicted arabinose efflux permease, MFS family n=1 Tax=Streptomyces misionensis TaxID=67331 RepID=A0A1H4VF62_9ACTN|nr:MFS transporter [Streptomyces misionensis]SEC79024.1 Predicted arabinose efflux permease, MFS family [Streptomyces misionensis]
MTHPLRSRDFRLLFVSRTMSTLSDALVPTALSLAVVEVTGSATSLAVVLGCALGARLLTLPVAGVLADRYDTRRVAFAADLVRVLTQAMVAVQLVGPHPSIALIAVAQAVAGVASAVGLANLSPLVIRAVPGSGARRQKANSLMGVAKSISQLAGPALAGASIWAVGTGWVFVLDSAAFAVSATMMLLVRLDGEAAPAGTRRPVLAGLAEGWAEVRARDWYWISLIAHATWNFAANVLLTLGPLVAVTRLGGQGTWIAVTQAGGIGLLAGSLVAGRARPRRPILAGNLVLASYALPLALFAVAAPVPVLVAGYGIAMAGLGFLNPTWQTAVQTAIPPHVLARVASYDWLVSLAAQPLGVILAPIALHAWGAEPPFAAAAVLVAVVCAGTALAPGVRDLRLERPRVTAPDGTRPLGGVPRDEAAGTP